MSYDPTLAVFVEISIPNVSTLEHGHGRSLLTLRLFRFVTLRGASAVNVIIRY